MNMIGPHKPICINSNTVLLKILLIEKGKRCYFDKGQTLQGKKFLIEIDIWNFEQYRLGYMT